MALSKTHKSPTRRMSANIDELIEIRYKLLLKGFVNKSELNRFVPCGNKKGTRIWDTIKDSVKAEGIEKLDGEVILTKRLIEYLGLTEKKVIDSYEAIKKG